MKKKVNLCAFIGAGFLLVMITSCAGGGHHLCDAYGSIDTHFNNPEMNNTPSINHSLTTEETINLNQNS